MTKIEELEKRLENLESQDAIRDLHRKYIYYVNSQKWDEVIDCFTQDATADIGMHGSHQGKEELSVLFKSKIAKVNEKWNGSHFVLQTIISTDGSKATKRLLPVL